jgi:hypothetical protein
LTARTFPKIREPGLLDPVGRVLTAGSLLNSVEVGNVAP